MIIKLCLVFCVFNLKWVKINADLYDDQPKILVHDGNLVFQSADSKNISIQLKGKGKFLINGFDFLDTEHGGANVSISEHSSSTESTAALRTQLNKVKNLIKGANGIIERLERLENGTNGTNDGPRTNGTRGPSRMQDRNRINQLNRRVLSLEQRLGNMTERLLQDNCRSFPCQNGGTCFNMYDSFRCECPANWEGPTCGQDTNECARFAGTDLGCQNGATCVNTQGSYECVCATGWKGLHCNRHTVDCLAQPQSEICGQGVCVQAKNKDLSYTCICNQGWTTANGTTAPACTVDVNECESATKHCSQEPMVMCVNTPGSFVCGPCPPGYSGNGYHCSDINECDTNNGGCSISPIVRCINSRGSSRCSKCPMGYDGDGKICTPSAGASTTTSFECSDRSMCHQNARCVQYPNSAPICICRTGYSGNGVGVNGCVAVAFDPCTALNCLNGGTCTANGTVATCQCPSGTVLPNCDRPIDSCTPNPCQNNGTCVKVGSTRRYKCNCPKEFAGVNCQSQTRSCGGIRRDESGTISFPDSTSEYHHNSKCAWLIKTNHTKVLNITFTKFQIEKSPECSYDWLQIHDGRSSASYTIGRFCGSTLPNGGNIISSHNQIYLWFRSDNSNAHEGFELSWESIDPVCGGEIMLESHGRIASPGSPGQYPPNRDCEWFITAPPNKRIQFMFYTLMIEAHETCDYDYVELHSGLGIETPRIGKYCNTSHPEPLLTPSHTATVHFHSDADSSDQGFQLAFNVVEGIPGCGGTYTAAKGDISSPNTVDGKYQHNMVCDYIISMPENNRVSIEFSRFKLEESNTCKFDAIEIYEGRSADELKLLGRYCGSQIPPKIVSQKNILLVKFVSDWSTSEEGFIFSYKLVCGGVYTAESGVISSPNYPLPYEADRSCEYDIIAPLGSVIELIVVDLDIEGHGVCQFDNLEIFDGLELDNTTSVGVYCGTQPPDTFVSNFNHIRVKFNSDLSIHGRGFKANYTFVDVECGGIVKDSNIVIRPPIDNENGGSYSSNADCKWLVVAPPGFVVQLNFLSFELELDPECQYDYVKIFFNGTGKGEQVGPYCGTKVPSTITSIDNIVTIAFHTDSSTSKDGFAISLSFIDATKLCGAHYFNTYGIIKSPGTPEYLPNKNCEWIITVAHGQQIELNFKYFELENNNVCKFDGLEIRNGGNSYSPLIGLFCDSMPDKIKSFSNELYLKFYSDSSRNDRGFELEWDATATGCGGILTSPRGSITSPGYPKAYGHNAQCEWRISVNEGSSIDIIFTDLDLETQHICAYDYLEIFDGTDSSASTFGKFCSSENHPMHLETTGNHAYIRMNTDDSHAGRGFSLKYSINCNRTILADSGIIESPNFPNDYPNNLNCSWTVMVNRGNLINMEFSHFEFENAMQYHNETGAQVCTFDYLEITELDRSGEVVHSRGKFCNAAPEPFNTTTEQLVLNFYSDVSATSTGFRAEWQIQGCGGRFTANEGVLTSPNYPQHYPETVDCEWIIDLEYGHNIEFTVHDMDLEREVNCTFDGFQIAHDAKFEHIVTKICHTITEPVVITGQGHKLYVKFFSDVSDGGKGFKASYKAVKTASGCGGLFTVPTGAIMSPNYPKNYGKDLFCEWTIRTSASHSLIFQLTDFDMEESDNCTKDSFAIYDKIFNKLLWEGCGSSLPNQTLFKSERNELMIRMKSDKDTEAKGFKGTFTTNCGANIITNDMGEVHYRKTIDSIDRCTWVFKSEDPLKHITIAFTYIHTHKDTNEECDSEFSILDGDTLDAPLKVTVCGSKVPPAIVSNGNALTVAITLGEHFPSEFSLHYSVLDNACGGTYNTIHGEFSSPGYPNSSPLDIQCEWIIEASKGNLIQLSIKAMDISTSYNCNDNYLEVRKNHDGGELVGTYCGNEIPTLMDSSIKYWVKYRTDGLNPNFGFLAEYSYLSHTDLQGKTGIIESPTYPRLIVNTLSNTYRIMVKQGAVIRLEFPELSLAGDEDYCEYFLTFYNGYDESAPLLSSDLCNPNTEPIVSDTNVVYFEFLHISLKGVRFQIQWNEVDKSTLINNTVESECIKTISLNNETFITNLTSPGYPYGYAPNMNCSWIISSGVPSYHPVIIFNDVNLEESVDCISDYVTVAVDRSDGSWKHLDRLCSIDIKSPRAFSGTPNLKVDFISDYHTNETGFLATTILECGGQMTDSDGIIEHNVQNAFVRPRSTSRLIQDCYWNITVRSGRTIQFEFLSMNLRNSSGECLVTVAIRNGIDETSPYLGAGKFCGTEIPIDIPQTSSNKAFVKFSSKQLTMGDFSLRYSEVRLECGGEIRLKSNYKSTIIHSPNYPSVSDAHVECFWTIMAPVGERIRIDFIERFDLTTTKECTTEYVELRDGSTSRAQMIGVFCDKRPTTQFSKSNVLRVKYFTDTDDPKNGFKMNISIATCGGMQRAEMGYVMSPGYPGVGAYPMNTTCEYRISGPPNTLFNISFSDIDLPTSRDIDICDLTQDHVKIQSVIPDLNSTGIESLLDIGTYCDNDQPPPLISDTNEIIVTFKTFKRTSNLRGFKLFYNSSKIECGGMINADSGIITSPGYPSQNLNKVFCEWKITVAKGRRIKAEFLDVDFISTGNQYLQRVGVYTDFKYSSRLLFVNRDINPGIVYSSDNTMMVALWIRMSSTNKGFKLRFSSDEETICAGDLNQQEGTIIPPVTVNNTAFTCDYIRTLDPSDPNSKGTLAMYFKDLQIGKKTTSNCRYASSVVNIVRMSGEDDNNKYLERLCGNSTVDQLVLSPFPDIKLEVRQSPFSGPVNFTLNYKTHPCGGMIRTGSLNNFTNLVLNVTNYGALDCAWFVEYGEGFNILINFENISMHLPCTKEYLKIYNGPTQMSPLLGTYCGNVHPTSTIYSQTNKIFIEYHTDNYNIAAEENSQTSVYKFATDVSAFGCGGILNRYSHEIKSPKYGKQYPNQLECIWEIRGDPGYHIGLTFSGRYFIEDSKNCSKDYLEIYDYKESNWTLLGRHCGRNIPPIYNATAEKMKIIFRTDESTNGDGFSAEWQQNCGGVLVVDETKKILSSPGYPKNYGNLLVCNYTFVTAEPNKYINLKFMDFNVEAIGARCMYDNLTIYKLIDWMIPPTFEKHGVYCGMKSPEKMRFKEKASMVFRSDRWIEKKGFQLEYSVDQCGGDIKESTVISTLTDETTSGETGSHNCVWNITAPSDKKIVIRFDLFSVEHSEHCIFDYVEIFNGHSLEEDQRLAKICGNLTNSLRPIVIQNSLAVLQYKTDQSNNLPGFVATIMFKPKCDVDITLTPDSPTFMLDKTSVLYDDQTECIYKVVAPPLSTIKMEVLQLHLSTCAPERNRSECSCDYLEVLDGNGPFSNTIGKYCGYSVPNEITSTNPALYLRFVTDSTKQSTGVQVRFTAIESPCGLESYRNITGDTIIRSPGSETNPPVYPPNTRCQWVVEAAPSKILEIEFQAFELEYDANCTKDRLIIEDSSVKDVVIEGLGKDLLFSGKGYYTERPNFYSGINGPIASHIYCGTVMPHQYISLTNKVKISFQSDSENQFKGFQMKVSIVEACSRNYTSLQGRLLSGDITDDCRMTITVPDNYTIAIYFIKFFFFEQDCTKAYMKLYDGDFETGTLLRTICGYNTPDPIFSNKNRISIHSTFDNSSSLFYSRGSYDLMYIATDRGRGCGGEIYNYGGVFSSPLYPNTNLTRENTGCTWTVSVPQNLKVAMRFQVLDMGSNLVCDYNYVSFMEEDENGKERELKLFCGSDDASVIVGSKSRMTVIYEKTVNFDGTGWMLQFMGVHEGSIPQDW